MEKNKELKKRPLIVWLLFILSIVCILASFYFGVRVYDSFSKHPRPMPRQTNVDLIQGWMTLPYISKVYGVPLPEIEKGLKLEAPIDKRINIRDLAQTLHIPEEQLIEQLKSIITAFQILHPTPPPGSMRP